MLAALKLGGGGDDDGLGAGAIAAALDGLRGPSTSGGGPGGPGGPRDVGGGGKFGDIGDVGGPGRREPRGVGGDLSPKRGGPSSSATRPSSRRSACRTPRCGASSTAR